ncbi:hypothetical protein [Burkholderia gladioli]|uniref:hypothetical protein n=1 Tax=Burkholderia gladioli TaxID=28095 RepID=UPI000F53E534|nr:hypothetical protein [Burkholderia gladioli]
MYAAERVEEFKRLTASGDFVDLPFRLEPFGDRGYTVTRMSPEAAARFVSKHRDAAMPCWDRFEIVSGRLTLAH